MPTTSYLVCAACKCRIGEDYATKQVKKEPYGDAVVCYPACFDSLARRQVSVYESLVREGTLRRPVVLPERDAPRRRGRRPRVAASASTK